MDGKPHSPARPFLTAGLFFWGLCLLFSLFLILAPGAAVLAADFEITPDELSFGPVRRGSSGNPGGPLEIAVTSEECGYAVYISGSDLTGVSGPGDIIDPAALKVSPDGEAGWLALSGEPALLFEAERTAAEGCSHLLQFTLDVPAEASPQGYRGWIYVDVTTLPVPLYEISVSAAPTEGGTVNGGAVYRDGENVTVTAEPYPGYRFSHWSESGTNISTEAAYSFTAQEDRQLVAHFTVAIDLWASYLPEQIIVETGSISAGSESDLAYVDDRYLTAQSGFTDGSYKLAWWGSFYVDPEIDSIRELTITYVGKCSSAAANDEYLSLFNFQTGGWEVIIRRQVSTNVVRSDWSCDDLYKITRYIGPAGEVRFRIYNSAPSSAGSFSRSTDCLSLQIASLPERPAAVFVPRQVNMEMGTIYRGSPSDMAATDGSCFIVNADSSNKAAWWTSWPSGIDRETITAITVLYQGSWSAPTNTMWLSLWDWEKDGWSVVLQAPSSTADQRWIWRGADWDEIMKFVSPDGEVRCRVYNSAAGPFQRSTDQLNLIIEYGPVKAFTFAHYTDVHHPGGTGYAPLSAVINDINSQAGISFAVNTGDTACYSKAEEFAGYAADIMQLNVPVYESPGNHDLRWYCSNGKADFREKLGQRGYTFFDYGGVRFLVLDSSIFMENDGGFDPLLLEKVAKNIEGLPPGTPVIAFAHHPELNLPLRHRLLEILQDANFKLFLGGHAHRWYKTNDNGVTWADIKDLRSGRSYALISITPTHIKVWQRNAFLNRTTLWFSLPRAERPQIKPLISDLTVDQVTGRVHFTVVIDPGDRILVESVQARLRSYAGYLTLESSAPGCWSGTIDPVAYNPPLPRGKHYLEVVVTDKRGDRWTVYQEYLWEDPQIVSLWEFETGGTILASPACYGGTVYAGSTRGILYAIDAATGNLLWSFETGDEIISTPAVYTSAAADQNMIIFGSGDRYLYALDALTGEPVWRFQTGGAVLSSPLVDDGKVYFGAGDKKVYCLNAADGTFIWSFQADGLLRQKPVISQGVLYTVIRDTKLWYAIQTADGSLKWLRDAQTGDSWMPVCDNSPVIVGGKVWVVKPDYTFSALDAESGAVVWTYGGSEQFSARGAIALNDRVINTSRDDVVIAWDSAGGAVVWKTPLRSHADDLQYKSINSALVAVDNQLYRISARGRVSCLDSSDGTVMFEYSISGLPEINFMSTPCAAGNYLFAGGLDGKVYALFINPDPCAR